MDMLRVGCEKGVFGIPSHEALGCLGQLVLCPVEVNSCKYHNKLLQYRRHLLKVSAVFPGLCTVLEQYIMNRMWILLKTLFPRVQCQDGHVQVPGRQKELN